MYSKEMAELIYDTLMDNVMYPQFNSENVEDCELDNAVVKFTYNGEKYELKVKRIVE